MRNLIVTMGGWPGDRYMSTFLAAKAQLEAYAGSCSADIAVIDRALDPDGRDSINAQKMLIPSAFSQYDIVVHIDLDVLLPLNLPNIFSSVPVNAGFSALVDPRESYAFQKAWGFADWTREGHRRYFENMGLSADIELLSVNGGVLAFRPRLIADLLKAWYVDTEKYAGRTDSYFHNEEGPMAYIAQTNGLFFPLDCRFNREVFFALHETDQGKAAYNEFRSLPNRIRRRMRKNIGLGWQNFGFGRQYVLFIEDLLRDGNLVHFAGKYPIPSVNPELLMGYSE